MSVALVGCGKMGSALLRGWIEGAAEGPFLVLEPQGVDSALRRDGVQFFTDSHAFCAAAEEAEVFVLAVKPQIMEAVCADLRTAVAPESLVLSIAAGQDIAGFRRRFSPNQPIVRAMPNTPAAIGAGMTVAVASPDVSPSLRARAGALLRAVGHVEWIADEGLMDAVTALSGSGPAYVFLLIEVLAEAGRKAGLDAALAMTLSRQTVIGSAALAANDDATDAAALRRAVTSPGGTTEAALQILMDGRLQTLFDAALAAARDRGRDLRHS